MLQTNEIISPGLELTWFSKTRWYRVVVELDLCGDLVLRRFFGGIGRRGFGTQVCAVGSEIPTTLEKISRERKAHGYVLGG